MTKQDWRGLAYGAWLLTEASDRMVANMSLKRWDTLMTAMHAAIRKWKREQVR